MKRIFLSLLFIFPFTVNANEPSTSCPTGYMRLVDNAFVLADSASECPTGYVTAGTVTSYLDESPAGNCMMFVPLNTEYTDEFGTYVYESVCPLTE